MDPFVLRLFLPVSIAILIGAIDDLIVDALWLWSWVKRRLQPEADPFPPGQRQLALAPKQRIAILIPLWQEDRVIGRMLEQTLAAVRYSHYEIFAGCYPNDTATQEVIREVAARHPQVHLALCPHDGPTSKADCLNSIYRYLALHEEMSGNTFDVIVTHDAEDMVHPDELKWVNYYTSRYDFLQMPVLPIASPKHQLLHGLYCDEFAEYHTRDMRVRAGMAFVPGAGVGTAIRRDALDELTRSGHDIFEPGALTEDYCNGYRMYALGCNQAFPPIAQTAEGTFLATREYFPMKWRAALRQRTRWVTGIVLQGMEQVGWRGGIGAKYWLWRDRKGLLGNPLSLLANALFVYALATGAWRHLPATVERLAWATMAAMVVRCAVRIGCSARYYGLPFALLSPLRTILGNILNSAASVCAIAHYSWCKLRGRPLRWLDLSHQYPDRGELLQQRRRLGEILVESGELQATQLDHALAACPPQVRLGEYLTAAKQVTEETVYRALSIQQGMPLLANDATAIRTLPRDFARSHRVLPFRIAERTLHLATPEPPAHSTITAIAGRTTLQLRFYLVPPSVFERKFATLVTCSRDTSRS